MEKSPIIYSVTVNYPTGPRFRIKAPHKKGFPSLEMYQRADLILDLTNRIVLKDRNYRQFHKVTDEEASLHEEYPLVCMTCINVTNQNGACHKCKGLVDDRTKKS